MNIVQVNGLKDTHLFDIWTDEKVMVDTETDEYGRIDLMVGGKELSLYLTKDWLVDKDGTFEPVRIRQYKLEESE